MEHKVDLGLQDIRSRSGVKIDEAPAERTEALAEVAHDARNMVAALGIYCELLEQPGVLATAFAHYSSELRLVASASHRLVDKLTGLSQPGRSQTGGFWRGEADPAGVWPARLPAPHAGAQQDGWESIPSVPVANLAAELLATRNLLAAVAGPGIMVTVDVQSGARAARITAEDLTRVLINLVKNGREVMPQGGRIQINLSEQLSPDGEWLVLTVEDNGPGIPEPLLDQIFESGFTSHAGGNGRASAHRGLGLTISRALIEAAGGRMYAENRLAGGARIVMELSARRG